MAAQGVPRTEWTRSAITYLEGTLWDDYQHARRQNGNERLDWHDLVAILQDIVTDSEVSKAALLKEVRELNFVKKAMEAKEEVSLHALLRECKQLISRLPQGYPDDEKCIHLLTALPKAVIHGRMTDPGTLESWKDFARLCRYANNEWGDHFKEFIKESKLGGIGAKRGKAGVGSYAMAVKRPR